MTDSTPLSGRARILLAALIIGFMISGGTLAWVLLRADPEPTDRPDTYDITGPQPGDLSPGLDILDNVLNYGLNFDLEYRFRTNSLGFRGPEPLAEGSPVILVLGDSFAFGMGVNEGETFPDHLRTELAKFSPRVVVHNAAIPGYTITDQLEQWEDKLSALNPDLVLLCHTASDLKEMARPTSFRRLVKYDDEVPELHDPNVADVIANAGGGKAEATRRFYTFTQAMLLERLGANAPVELKKLRSMYTRLVLRLAGKTKLALVVWAGGYGMAGLTTEPVITALRAASIPVFPGALAMQRQGTISVEKLFLPDGHFSPAGNRIAAKQTAAWLRERL